MKKTLAPSVTTRDPKGLKFISIVEAAYNKAGLTMEEAQRVNDAPGLSDLVRTFIAVNRSRNQCADEEVDSGYTYPPEYRGPKPIKEQIEMIAKIFDLDPSQALEFAENLPALPEGAEGWFAIPSVDALAAKHFPEVTDPAEKYCCAVRLVHDKIAFSRALWNYREFEIIPSKFRVHARTAQALQQLALTQPGDILVIAAQLGMRHRGRSIYRAREVFVANEFGLGSVAGGSITLTHPERFVRDRELDMDLPGDEFALDADGFFSHAPCFRVDDDELGFGAYCIGTAYDGFGSASAFSPKP